MNKKIRTANLLFSLMAMLICLFHSGSWQFACAVDNSSELYDEIVAYKLETTGAENIQQWINTELTENAGSSEWYIFSLLHEKSYDFTSYRQGLESYLSNNKVSSASTRQKYACILYAIAPESSYIAELSENTIGLQGVMSYIYGLHLLNNGVKVSSHTEDSVVEQLMSMQLQDGGWAVMGAYGDTDVTAMAVQALAVHSADEKVAQSLEKAVEFLSSKQNESGDYSSYGTANSESTAQVLTALSSLSIDAESDERFIKNGNTIFDGLALYKTSNGAYSHAYGEEASDLSTAQVFNSLTAYKLMKQGEGTLYTFDADEALSSTVETETTSSETAKKKSLSLKLIIGLSVAVVIIACIIIMLVRRKADKRSIMLLLLVLIAAELIVLFTDFKTADEYYNESKIDKGEIIGTVTMTIRCDTIADIDEEYIPENGVILSECEFSIDSNDTAYDILTEAVREYAIHLESSGADGMKYINGINHIYELQYGDLSGWMYFVNDEEMSEGCDGYTVKDGDNIEWHYTREMGKDLE